MMAAYWRERNVVSAMKPMLKKLLFSTLLTLGLAEVVLRVYGHAHPSLLSYHPNRYTKYKARPGDLSYGFPINDDGFKDKPFTTTRRPGEYRMAAIGDSFVFGMVPYEHTFCTRIEERFPHVNVMNYGVIGTAPEDYITVLKNDALSYAPDAVMVFIYVGNDFLFNRRKWYEYSALGTFLNVSIKSMISYQGQDIRQNYRYDDNMTPFSRDRFIETLGRYSQTYRMDFEPFDGQFDRAMQSIRAMRELCAARSIRFYVVLLPDRLQLDEAVQQDVAKHLGLPIAAFDFSRPQTKLKLWLSDRNIEFVDLYDVFAAEAGSHFIRHDIHLNLRGNQLVADAIPARWLLHD